MFKPLKILPLALWLLVPSLGQQPPSASAAQCFQGASAGYVHPRLAVGMSGHAVATVKVHAQPSTNSQITGSLSPSKTFKVISGPRCSNNYVWWQVAEGRLRGWVAEANPVSSKYWLAPNR